MDIGHKECYVGMLYACYDLIRPDLVLELSWRHGLTDFAMPYMINMLSQQTKELTILKADNEARKAKEKEQEKDESTAPILGSSRLMITAGPGGAAPAGNPSPSPVPYGQTNGFAPQQAGFAPQATGFAPQPTGYGY